MGQTLQCIRHCARLVEDQAKVLEAGRLWKNLGANLPSACSSRAIENNNFCLEGIPTGAIKVSVTFAYQQSASL